MDTRLNGHDTYTPPRHLLGPDGLPITNARFGQDGFPLPHVLQMGAIIQSGFEVFWDRWDEARRHSRENALAMEKDCFLQSLLQERALATSTLKWHVHADDEKDPYQKALKDGMQRVLGCTPHKTRMHFETLKGGMWYGRSANQRVFEWRELSVPVVKAMPVMPGGPSTGPPLALGAERISGPGIERHAWVTVGGHAEGDESHVGGHPVNLPGGRAAENAATKPTATDTTKLSFDRNPAGWPKQTTLGELKEFAKKKLGARYAGIVVRHYGGGSQVEVLRIKNGYHGREKVREAVYPLSKDGEPVTSATAVSAEDAQGFYDAFVAGELLSRFPGLEGGEGWDKGYALQGEYKAKILRAKTQEELQELRKEFVAKLEGIKPRKAAQYLRERYLAAPPQDDPFAGGLPGNPAGVPAAVTVADERRRCLVVKKHQPVHGDSIYHKFDGTPVILTYSPEANLIAGAQITWTTAGSRAVVLKGSWRERFVVYAHESKPAEFFDYEKAEAAHGAGLRDVAYWAWWMKTEYLEWFTTFFERFGLGLRLWYYEAGNPQSQTEVYKIAVENSRRTNILVPVYGGKTGKAYEGGMESIETPVAGTEVITEMMRYFDHQMERYFVGQSMSSGDDNDGSLGGTGRAQFAANTKYQLVKYDADNLADCYTSDWVGPVQRWTYPECKDVPLEFRFNVPDPDNAAKMAGVQAAISFGVDFKKDEVRGLTGMSDPQPGDDIVGGMEQLVAQMEADAAAEEEFAPEVSPDASRGDGAERHTAEDEGVDTANDAYGVAREYIPMFRLGESPSREDFDEMLASAPLTELTPEEAVKIYNTGLKADMIGRGVADPKSIEHLGMTDQKHPSWQSILHHAAKGRTTPGVLLRHGSGLHSLDAAHRITANVLMNRSTPVHIIDPVAHAAQKAAAQGPAVGVPTGAPVSRHTKDDSGPDMALWEEVKAVVPAARPATLPHLCGTAGGARVYLVDGEQIKLRRRKSADSSHIGEAGFMDFVEGGNGEEDSELCGKDEVYVDATLEPVAWPFVAYHECHERRDMAAGMTYDAAHERANAGEKALRAAAEKPSQPAPEPEKDRNVVSRMVRQVGRMIGLLEHQKKAPATRKRTVERDAAGNIVGLVDRYDAEEPK